MSFGVAMRNSVSLGLGGIPSLVSGSRGNNPTLNLNFTSGVLDSRVTFTRASTGTFTGSNGLIQTAAINAPRFNYNPTTFASLGLLIEEQRTNLSLRSEEFDNAAWIKTNLTATANAIASPDGTLNADKLVENTTALVDHRTQQLVTISNTTAYTGSVYLKAGERTIIDVLIYRGATFAGASVNLLTGVASAPLSPAVVNLSATTVVTNVGNGWYRVSIPITSDGISGGIRITLTNGLTIVYTGDGVSGVNVWGAQLEAGTFATSYIPTVASQVTRSPDSATITGANFSSWYNAAEGTFFANIISAPVNNIAQIAWYTSDGTSNNVMFSRRNTSATFLVSVVNGGVPQADIASGAAIAGGAAYKAAFAYKLNNFGVSTNAAPVGTDTSGTVPIINSLELGARTASQYLNGTIRQFSFYPQRLPNSQLQALTT